MVDSQGRTLLVSHGNTSLIDPTSGRAIYQFPNDHGLFKAMGGAGSSFGIVTEFLYKIYPRPEPVGAIVLIYVESSKDLRKLEKATKDGRCHVSWGKSYAFRNLFWQVNSKYKEHFF